MKVWIDHSNSPHPLLFAPIARRLVDEGHQVLTSVRDNAQTVELVRARWPEAEVIGGESPRGRVNKAATIATRVMGLRRWAKVARPDVALSHNSYAQIVAAWSLGVPVVTAMDFEHQPANHLAFRLAKTVLVPEALPAEAMRRQGATARKLVRYEGLKEELYVGDFEPDERILASLGLEPRPRVVVVMRTPPSRAAYHPAGNPLFDAALQTLAARDDLVCVVLPRHSEQVAAIAALGLPNCIVPGAAIDSRSLLYASDAMIGAGGTMTREAALLGIPTWTAFAGASSAVDRWLEGKGMLTRLTDPTQLGLLGPRPSEPRTPEDLRQRGQGIERVIVGAAEAAAQSGETD